MARLASLSDVIELYQGLENNLSRLIGPQPFSAANNLRLERINHLLELLGNPHHAFTSIHVGGTSGKGSTSAMIAAILTEAGYTTGLHMSPHLQIINERHQINRHVASTSRLSALFAEMQPAIEQVARDGQFGSPSYFETQVALGFLLFQREAVDVAVVEVGLGGSLDATNVLNSSVAVLTNFGLDHTAILGNTIEQIARDKAGIIKPGQTVVSGIQQQTGRQIVADRCRSQAARLWQIDQNFTYTLPNGRGFSLSLPGGNFDDLHLGMPGNFQAANAACAVAAVQALPADFSVPEQAVRHGLLNARIPGRVELVQRDPLVILDGAHNPEKMRASREAINQHFPNRRRVTVLALKSDKASADVLAHVLPDTDVLLVTQFRVPGSLWSPQDATELAQQAAELAPGLRIGIIPDPILAFNEALAQANPDDLIWVTGSFYLVGNVRELWYPSAALITQAETGLSGAMAL
ncbi:MAG: folylpolyglutamate synthase/dihydrofolate synthase family protein [Anaerolineae bacterium]